MRTLRSYVCGKWHEAREGFVELVDPSTESAIARASSQGIDFGAALDHARERGGSALRELSVPQRAELLGAMSKVLHEHRDELIALSVTNTGSTRRDSKFDVDGGPFSLSHYAALGRELGDRGFLIDGEGDQLGRSARYWGQHVWMPRTGVAVHVNAFNFPVWGFAEKAACALLAGVPVITKPATSSAWVAHRAVEVILEAGILPEGALTLICGSTGDLLDRLGPQDVFAFTGSASTALSLRGKRNLLESSTAVNVEADSLNAAVLAPDVERDSETWAVFLNDVNREMTQKTGQKCTAVRRILVPRGRLDEVQEALLERLGDVVVGNPEDPSVTMGPLATADQLVDAIAGLAELGREADRVRGTGQRVDGVGSPQGKGYFVEPTLLRAETPERAEILHAREVFGPVATLMAYEGGAREAAALVARGGGSLVSSVYGNDPDYLAEFVRSAGSSMGRLYIGSEKVAGQLPGSGVAMPQMLHGGPGRAGGGIELGGRRGLALYMQPLAISGDRALLDRLLAIDRQG